MFDKNCTLFQIWWQGRVHDLHESLHRERSCQHEELPPQNLCEHLKHAGFFMCVDVFFVCFFSSEYVSVILCVCVCVMAAIIGGGGETVKGYN